MTENNTGGSLILFWGWVSMGVCAVSDLELGSFQKLGALFWGPPSNEHDEYGACITSVPLVMETPFSFFGFRLVSAVRCRVNSRPGAALCCRPRA